MRVHGIVLVRMQAMTDILDARIGDLLISQHEGAPEEGNRVTVVLGRAWWLGGGMRH
jgi:hypothetical protein